MNWFVGLCVCVCVLSAIQVSKPPILHGYTNQQSSVPSKYTVRQLKSLMSSPCQRRLVFALWISIASTKSLKTSFHLCSFNALSPSGKWKSCPKGEGLASVLELKGKYTYVRKAHGYMSWKILHRKESNSRLTHGKMKKHVKVTRTVTVEVDSDKEIDDVKDIFCELEEIGTNLQNTFFIKRNFENGQALDYERKDGSSVHMNLHLGVRMQILIKVSWSAKLIPLDVHSWDTIHDVKTKFQDKEGIPANQLSLIYIKQLEDFQTLEAYRIYNGCVVYAVSLGEDKFEISIKMPEGETVQLEVKLCSSVENVKTMFQCMMGFPIDHQNLIFNGASLENNKILADYKIQKNSALYFTFAPGVINITVMRLSGRKIIFNVNSADTIYDLKTKVIDKEGIPVDQQRLIFKGKLLEDERTVGECKIQDGCTVYLVPRS